MSPLDELKADFKKFVAYIWKHLLLPPPTPIQDDISDYLQRGPKRSVIEAFRGVGKSWITSVFVLWLLLRDPQLKVLVVSASKDRADAFSTFTKRLIAEVDILQHLQPKNKQRDSNVAFDVGPARAHHAPSVKSVGIFGQLAGSRADVIVADDIEVPKNSYTLTMRERLSEAVKEFDAVLTPAKHSRIIYLGTPQCEMSLYNVLPNRGYEVKIWPARMPGERLRKFFGNRLAPYILKSRLEVGAPTDPERFNDFDLIERETSYGRSGFALQFMLDTSLSDANKYPLKLSDLIVWNIDLEKAPVKFMYGSGPEQLIRPQDLPMVGLQGDRLYRPLKWDKEWRPYQGAVMLIDPAGRGRDETGYAISKMMHGNIFLCDAGGFTGGYEEKTLNTLAEKAKEGGVHEIVIESNFGDGMFLELMKPILKKHEYTVTLSEIRNSVQKERRIIDVLEPVMNQHRLIVDEELIRRDARGTDDINYQLFYQMTRMTLERGALAHDDRLDAVAESVAYWKNRLAKEQDSAADEWREEQLNKELAHFAEHVMGVKPQGPKWFHA